MMSVIQSVSVKACNSYVISYLACMHYAGVVIHACAAMLTCMVSMVFGKCASLQLELCQHNLHYSMQVSKAWGFLITCHLV